MFRLTRMRSGMKLKNGGTRKAAPIYFAWITALTCSSGTCAQYRADADSPHGIAENSLRKLPDGSNGK